MDTARFIIRCKVCKHETVLADDKLYNIAQSLAIKFSEITQSTLLKYSNKFKCTVCGEKNIEILENLDILRQQNYIKLLESLVKIYQMEGLPPTLDGLFDNYVIPSNIPSVTPQFVFIDYPQRPHHDQHDFSLAKSVILPQKQLESTHALFNEDFTLALGYTTSITSEYGYGTVLIRNDKLRIYTMKYTISMKPYRQTIEQILSDIEELVILSLYRYRERLSKYSVSNSTIKFYLERGYISREQNTGYWPITCFECKNSSYIARPPMGKSAIPCNICYEKWKKNKKVQRKQVQRYDEFDDL